MRTAIEEVHSYRIPYGANAWLDRRLVKVLPLLLSVPLIAGSLRVYVANTDGASISIIDVSTNQVVGEIPVSKNPHAVLLSPDKTRFYVPSESEDVLDVIDRPSLKSIARVPLGRRPNNLAITPDGRYVYVCIRQESWVAVVDTQRLQVVKKIPVGRNPHNVYLLPDRKHMLATSMGDNKLTLINTETQEPQSEMPLPGVPRPLAMDESAKHLFIQLSNLHGFIVFDPASCKTVKTVLLPEAPPGAKPLIPETFSHGIAVTPDQKTIWVNSLLSNSVSVFSLPDLALLGTIPVGRGPDWMTFLPDGSRCYISNAGSNSVSVIDVATRKELTQIPVGRIPKRIIAAEIP
jgi:YVTN family beta-propeller protein